MDLLILLVNALLAIFLGSDTGHWRPDTSISTRQKQRSDLGTDGNAGAAEHTVLG